MDNLRKLFRIRLLCMLFFFYVPHYTVFSQRTSYITDTNSSWEIEYRWLPPSPLGYNGYGVTSLAGDTIINIQEYFKVMTIRLDIYCTDIVVSGPTYRGAIRNDSSQNAVYFIPKGSLQEYLLYDYELIIGDTLKGITSYHPCEWSPLLCPIVASIDSVVFNNGLVKTRWNFSNGVSLIRDMGSSTGLVENMWTFEEDSWIRCFKNSDTLLYSYASNCKLPTDTCFGSSIMDISNDNQHVVHLFPNPVNGIAYISTSLSQKTFELTIQDMNGKVVYDGKSLMNPSFINLSEYKSGTYIYTIVFKDGVKVSESFIVNNQ